MKTTGRLDTVAESRRWKEAVARQTAIELPLMVKSSLDCHGLIARVTRVREIEQYHKSALKLAEVKFLGKGEGYSARIPQFKGLVVFAATKAGVMNELDSALEGWIELSLTRGDGLPSLHSQTRELVSAH